MYGGTMTIPVVFAFSQFSRTTVDGSVRFGTGDASAYG